MGSQKQNDSDADTGAHEGWKPELQNTDDLFHSIEEAFDYRGDVTVVTHDGDVLEGYVFDRKQEESPEASVLRMMPSDGSDNRTITYSDVKQIEFTGEDATMKNPWPPEGHEDNNGD